MKHILLLNRYATYIGNKGKSQHESLLLFTSLSQFSFEVISKRFCLQYKIFKNFLTVTLFDVFFFFFFFFKFKILTFSL